MRIRGRGHVRDLLSMHPISPPPSLGPPGHYQQLPFRSPFRGRRPSFDRGRSVSTENYDISFNNFSFIHCVQKKETKMFSVISSIKLGQFWWNLVDSFLNKFASKLCKRSRLHLNNLSTLPREILNVYHTHAIDNSLEKKTPEFVPPIMSPPNLSDLYPVDYRQYRVWEILQEKVNKTRITDQDPSTMPLITVAAMTLWSSVVQSIIGICFCLSRLGMSILWSSLAVFSTLCWIRVQRS